MLRMLFLTNSAGKVRVYYATCLKQKHTICINTTKFIQEQPKANTEIINRWEEDSSVKSVYFDDHQGNIILGFLTPCKMIEFVINGV